MIPDSSDGAGADFVVRRDRLDSAQEHSGFWFENRSIVVRTCKLLHCIERIEEVQHHKFHLVWSVVAKNVPTPVAGDAAELGEHLLLQQILVCVRVRDRGPTSPVTCNQGLHHLAASIHTVAFRSVIRLHMRFHKRWIWVCALIACAALGQEFEAVSVKANPSIGRSSGFRTDPGRLTATNVSLRGLIVRAYGVKDFQVEGPDWLRSERFDVSATFPDPMPKDSQKRDAAFHQMMQSMLADRFKLVVHREQRIRPVYAMTAGKGGVKFKEAVNCDSRGANSSDTHYAGTCVSMEAFSAFLAGRHRDLPVDLPVLDMTGLAGFYDLTLDWVPGSTRLGDSPTGLMLPVALEEQLGLKLETRRAPVEMLMVDHAERAPTEN